MREAKQAEQLASKGAFRSGAARHAVVIENDRKRRAANRRFRIDHRIQIRDDLDVPARARQYGHESPQHFADAGGCQRVELAVKVDAHTADATPAVLFDLFGSERERVDHHYAAAVAFQCVERVQNAGIVHSVEAGLYENEARDTHGPPQPAQGLYQSQVCGIRAVSYLRILRGRPDDVDVAIAGARRRQIVH